MENFKDFEEMMEKLGGLKYDENLSIAKDIDVEEINGYLAMYAHSGTTVKALDFAEKNGFHVITETIYDGDDNEIYYIYTMGLSIVNRERYYFVKKYADFYVEERVDLD
jgi:hypothetical protein